MLQNAEDQNKWMDIHSCLVHSKIHSCYSDGRLPPSSNSIVCAMFPPLDSRPFTVPLLLLAFLTLPCAIVCNSPVLPFLNLGEEIQGGSNLRIEKNGRLFGIDEGASPVITLPTSLSFGNYTVNTAYVTANGLISFDTEFMEYSPQPFPRQGMIVAPYWEDIDLREKGVVLYTLVTPIHRTLSGLITDVSDYISNSKRTRFRTQWILVARWVDVCPYANNNCNNGNTFQVVIATDSKRTYAVFTYNCQDLNWRRHGPSIGYSANSVLFENHPLSNNVSVNEIACKNNDTSPWSNVVYRINDISDLTILSPTFGNIAGGSGVLVSGPRFNTADNIKCMFGDQNVNGVVLDNETVLCTTPRFSHSGTIPVHISQNDIIQEQGANFYSVPFENARVVDVQTDSLLLETEKSVRVLWPSHLLLPSIESIDTANSIVDVKLYKVDLTSGAQVYKELATLAQYLPNSGDTILTIPSITVNESICQVSIAVEARSLPISQPQYKFSLWSGVMYLVATSTRDFRERCQQWADSQSDGVGEELLKRVSDVYSCPPTLNRVQSPNSGFESDIKNSEVWPTDSYNVLLRTLLNPGISVCYRQRNGFESTKGSSNQCCYGNKDRLLVGHPGGGNVDFVASKRSIEDHIREDVLPYLWCCKGDFPSCATYYRYRPSDNGVHYKPAPPGCVYGDPHLVTLDLHKYTFNGYGEYVLIGTMDDSFTLQGRMVEATTNSVLNIPSTGTIFSALVAKESHSDTAQLQLDPLVGIIALVNGEHIDFSDITEQEFNNLTVADLGNRTIVATFSGGAFLKVQEENGIISVLIVSLPSSYQNKTQGLMGNYNGNKSDDLIPKGGTESLSLDSTPQDIHENFGITWIIDNEIDSLFSYKTGENWTTFHRLQYTPLYGPVFLNSAIDKEVCKNDTFCLYDIAATGRVEIGMTTLRGSEGFDQIVALSAPVVCNPPCQNGACVDHNNTCYCSFGYAGTTCNITVYTECIQYPCLNNGICKLHAGSYICTCMPQFTGYFCQDLLNPTTGPPGVIPNQQLYIIIGATAGGILLVVCIALLVAVTLCVRHRKKPEKPKTVPKVSRERVFRSNFFNYRKFTVIN